MNGPKVSLNAAPAGVKMSPAMALDAPVGAAEKSRVGGAVAAAVIAHVAIIALLSVQWTAGKRTFENPPMEVDLVAETAPTSTAPVITAEAPAARLGDEDMRDIEVPESAPAPTPPTPQRKAPTPAPTPKPTPKSTPKAAPPAATKAPSQPAPKTAPSKPKKQEPAKKAATPAPKGPAPKANSTPRPTGNLDGIVDGLAKAPSKSTQTKGAPATATAAEVKRSIDVAIDGAIVPYWRRNVPSGVDVDQLRVVLRINLSKDGRVVNITQRGQLQGKTDSNVPQQALFVERAMRSIRQAAPFDLPEEHYDQWKVWDMTFRAKGM